MKLHIYSIRDRAVQEFMTPFFMQQDALALRAFRNIAGDPTSDIGKNPEDFDLWHIGVWDSENGEVTMSDNHILLRGIEFMSRTAEEAK